MPIYHVPVTVTTTEVYRVTADSKEEAMFLAIDDEDPDYCEFLRDNDGDREVDFNQITVIEEGENQ